MGVMGLGWVWRAWHGFKGLYEGIEGFGGYGGTQMGVNELGWV